MGILHVVIYFILLVAIFDFADCYTPLRCYGCPEDFKKKHSKTDEECRAFGSVLVEKADLCQCIDLCAIVSATRCGYDKCAPGYNCIHQIEFQSPKMGTCAPAYTIKEHELSCKPGLTITNEIDCRGAASAEKANFFMATSQIWSDFPKGCWQMFDGKIIFKANSVTSDNSNSMQVVPICKNELPKNAKILRLSQVYARRNVVKKVSNNGNDINNWTSNMVQENGNDINNWTNNMLNNNDDEDIQNRIHSRLTSTTKSTTEHIVTTTEASTVNYKGEDDLTTVDPTSITEGSGPSSTDVEYSSDGEESSTHCDDEDSYRI